MKVYFSAAITGIPPSQRETYQTIVDTLEGFGHRVFSDHVLGKEAKLLTTGSDEEVLTLHRRMIVWKNQADVVVVEASFPSFAVGQEISYALTNEIPVVVLHQKGKRPRLLQAVGTEYLYVVEYDREHLKQTLAEYIEYAKDMADTRFNFFVSSEIDSFLNWISKKRKVPRAVFLRQLIEEDMRHNRQYQKEGGKEASA